MLRVFGVLILISAFNANSQQISVQPPSIPGLDLIGPQSSQFNVLVTEIVGSDRPNGLIASLPYGVVIRNGTQEALAAIDIVWTANGQPKPVLLNAAEQWFTMPQHFVQSSQAVLAVPAGILESPRNLRIFSGGSKDLWGRRLENFERAEIVAVAVDAVVYASGQFVGTDKYGAYERWHAEINAPRTLAAAILQRKETQPTGDIILWIETLAANWTARDADVRQTALTARLLLAAYRNKGESELYSHAQSILQQPTFPLHR